MDENMQEDYTLPRNDRREGVRKRGQQNSGSSSYNIILKDLACKYFVSLCYGHFGVVLVSDAQDAILNPCDLCMRNTTVLHTKIYYYMYMYKRKPPVASKESNI